MYGKKQTNKQGTLIKNTRRNKQDDIFPPTGNNHLELDMGKMLQSE